MTLEQSSIDPQTGLNIRPAENQFNINVPDVSTRQAGSYGVGQYRRDDRLNLYDVFDNPDELNYQRAAMQTGAELWGKAIGQGLAEATMGSIEGAGYLLDFEDLFNNDDMATRDFDNWFSKGIRQAKEHVQEDWMPIYQSRIAEGEDFSNKLGDATWWANQGKTIGVTASMLIPAMATGGASMATGLGKSASMAIAGLASAKIEATMEASQKFQEQLDRSLNNEQNKELALEKTKQQFTTLQSEYDNLFNEQYDLNSEDYSAKMAGKAARLNELSNSIGTAKSVYERNLETIARQQAGEAASLVYKANAIKAPLEVAQFMMLGNSFDAMRKGLQAAKATKAGMIAGAVFQPASEAGEELYQGFASQDASRAVEDGKQFFGEGAIGRFGEYATSDEGQEAAFLGAGMGLLFEYGGRSIKKGVDNIKKATGSLLNTNVTVPEDVERIARRTSSNAFINSYEENGVTGIEKTTVNAIAAFDRLLENDKLTPDDKKRIETQKQNALSDAKLLKDIDTEVASNPILQDSKIKNAYVKAQMFDKVFEDDVRAMDEIKNRYLNDSGLEGSHVKLYDNISTINQLNSVKKELLSDKTIKKEKREEIKNGIDSKIEKLKTEQASLIEGIKQTAPNFNVKDLAPRRADEINKFNKNKLESEVKREYLTKPVISSFASLNKAKVEEAVNEVVSGNIASETLNAIQDLKTIKTQEGLTAFETNIASRNPEVYNAIMSKIEEQKLQFKATQDNVKLNAKLKNNTIQFKKNIINKAQSKEDLIKAKSTVEKLQVSKEDKVALTKEIDEKINTFDASEIEPKLQSKPQPKEQSVKLTKQVGRIPIGTTGKIVGVSKAGNTLFQKEGQTSSISIPNDAFEVLETGFTPTEREKAELNEFINVEANVLSQEEIEGIEELTPNEVLTVNTEEVVESSEDDGTPILTMEDKVKIDESEKQVDGSSKVRLFQTEPRILITTKAKASKVIKNNKNEELTVYEYDDNGMLKIMPLYDASIAKPESFSENSTVVLSVNNSLTKDGNLEIPGQKSVKLTIDNIPITIQSKEGFESKAQGFMSIRDLSNPAWDNMDSSARAKTKELRKKIFDEYIKTGSATFYTTVTSKDGGWTNKMQNSKPLDSALKVNGFGYGNNIEIANSDRKSMIKTKNGDFAINNNVPAGIPHLIITNAIGEKVGIQLEFQELANMPNPDGIGVNNEVYNKYVENTLAIFDAHALNDLRFEAKGVFHKEIGKYFNLRKERKLIEDKVNLKDANLHNNAFGAQKDKNVLDIYLPNKVGVESNKKSSYKHVKIVNENGVLKYYQTKQDKMSGGTVLVEYKEGRVGLLYDMKTRLDQMYPNINNMSAEDMNNFSRFEANETGQLTQVNEHYMDFLSKANVKTKVMPIVGKDGLLYYVTEPNITISEDIRKPAEEVVVQNKAPMTNDSEMVFKTPSKTDLVFTEQPEINKEEDYDPSLFDDSNNFDNIGGSADLVDKHNGIDFNESTLSSFNNLKAIIEEDAVISSLLQTALGIMDKARDEGRSISYKEVGDGVFKALIQRYAIFNKFANQQATSDDVNKFSVSLDKSKNATIANNLKLFVDNFERVVDKNGKVKFVGYRSRIIFAYQQLGFAVAEVDEDAPENGETESQRHIEGANYKTDPEKSTSGQIKRLLSSIRVRTKDDKLKSTMIGTTVNEDFGKVFNYLMESLSNIAIKDMIAELNELAGLSDLSDNSDKSINYIAQDVVSRLNQAEIKNPGITNKFLSVFKKQNAKFISLLFEDITNDKGETTTKARVTETNRSGAKDVIIEKWKVSNVDNGYESGLYKTNEQGNTVIDKDKSVEIKNQFLKAIESISKKKKIGEQARENRSAFMLKNLEPIVKVFNSIGLNVSKEALLKMQYDFNNKDYKKYFKKEFQGDALKANEFGQFIQIYYSEIFNSLVSNQDIFENQRSIIKSLAVYEQKFDLDVSSQSFRNAAGDMIYGFVNPHHLSNTVDKLNSGDQEYIANKSNSKFSTKATWLKTANAIKLTYFDASRNKQNGSMAKSYEDQNAFEKEVTKLSLFLNNGNKNGLFFSISPSDKTTFPMIFAPKFTINNGSFRDGKLTLTNEALIQLSELFIMSEVERINQVASESQNLDKSKLLNNYHSTNGSFGGGMFFYMIPELNTLPRKDDGSIEANTVFYDSANKIMLKFFEEQISKRLGLWKNIGIENNIDSTVFKQYNGNINDLVADFIINNSISYANQFMLFTGDPAKFAKSTVESISDYKSIIEKTLPNIFKRTAKDIAPGIEGKFDEQNYRVLFINEPKADSILAKELSAYSGIKLADAQEWTTLEEHCKVLKAYGKINQSQYDNILANRENLTLEQIKVVMQPIKPVQVSSILSNSFEGEVEYYIKTSSFPLIPQLTKKFPELEKMRLFMENKDNNISRIAPSSAVKTGFHKSIELFKDGKFNDDNGFTESNIHVLNRSGFRIQQDVPFDANKEKIIEGSQMRKMIFLDIEDVLMNEMGFEIDGVKYSGKQLKQLSDKIHIEQYQRRLEEVKKKLKVDSNGKITDVNALKDLMVEEGIDRKYSINDILMLATINDVNGKSVFNLPLFFHPMVHKIESLVNSIIKNKVLKNKLPGKSYVQGSSVGFTVADENFLKIVDNNGVVFTKDYKGNLDYREYNGELFAEVFLPSTFLGVDLKQFVSKDGFLDVSKIDKELLTAIGYRIPTQGFSSIVRLKVVGLLPEMSGDLIIVPPAMVVQMGSDFDVDKLYIHRYNNYVDKNTGKVKKVKFKNDNTESSKLISTIFKSSEFFEYSDEALQNKLMDIFHSILKNKDIQKKTKTPLDSEEIKKLVEGKLKKESSVSNSIISDELHSNMIDIQASGKTGIAVTSTWSTDYAQQQYAGTYLKSYYNKDKESWFKPAIMFSRTNKDVYNYNDDTLLAKIEEKDEYGNITTYYTPNQENPNNANKQVRYKSHSSKGAFRLDKITGFTGRPISSVMINIQTEAVDNANNGRLFGMGLNKNTFDVAMLIASVGYDEEMIGTFLRQPIVEEYVKRLGELNNFTESEYVKDKKDKLKKKLFEEIGITEELDDLKVENITLNDMDSALNSTNLKTDLQKIVLKNFLIYENIVSELKTIRRALNVDTKYLGSSFSGVASRFTNFENNVSSAMIGNTEALYVNTISGEAHKVGVIESIKMFGDNNLLPYNSVLIKSIFEQISLYTDMSLSEQDSENISIEIRSALYNEALKNALGIEDISKFRETLLFDEKINIAKIVIEAQKKFPNNELLKSLHPQVSIDKKTTNKVTHYSSKEAKADLDMRKQIGWLELLNSTQEYNQKVGRALLIHSITFGTKRTANDYGRFISVDYLLNSGISEGLRSIDFNSTDNNYSQKLAENFVRQYFQHNPNRLPEIPESIKNIEEASRFVKKFNKTTKKVEVYELNKDGKYIMLDRLGDDMHVEYDLSNNVGKTILKTNPVSKLSISTKSTVVIGTQEIVEPKGGQFILNNNNFDGGNKAVLGSIVKNNNNNKDIAQFFLDNFEAISKFNLEKYNSKNENHYDVVRDGVVENPKGRAVVGDNNLILINAQQVANQEDFERTYLHELTHAYFNELISNQYSMTESQIKAYNELIKIIEFFKKNASPEAISKFQYAISSPKEFVSEMFANEEFKNTLNSITYKETKLLDKIKDLLKKIFGDVKRDSLLESALNEVFEYKDSSKSKPSQPSANLVGNKKVLELLNKDVTLTKTYKDVMESWEVYENKFNKLGYKREDIAKMSATELGKFIKDNIC